MWAVVTKPLLHSMKSWLVHDRINNHFFSSLPKYIVFTPGRNQTTITKQVPKMDVFTYISCMDTAYVRKNPRFFRQPSVLGTWKSWRNHGCFTKKPMGMPTFHPPWHHWSCPEHQTLDPSSKNTTGGDPLAMRTTKLKVRINCGWMMWSFCGYTQNAYVYRYICVYIYTHNRYVNLKFSCLKK